MLLRRLLIHLMKMDTSSPFLNMPGTNGIVHDGNFSNWYACHRHENDFKKKKKSRKSCQKGPNHHEKEGKCINFDQKSRNSCFFPENFHAWCQRFRTVSSMKDITVWFLTLKLIGLETFVRRFYAHMEEIPLDAYILCKNPCTEPGIRFTYLFHYQYMM